MTKHDVKKFKVLMSSFGRLKALAQRQAAAKGRSEASASAAQPKASLPAYTALIDTAPETDHNSNNSLLLTLAGLKVALLEPSANEKDIVDTIGKDAGWKFAQRDLTKHINSGVAASYRGLVEEAKF